MNLTSTIGLQCLDLDLSEQWMEEIEIPSGHRIWIPIQTTFTTFAQIQSLKPYYQATLWSPPLTNQLNVDTNNHAIYKTSAVLFTWYEVFTLMKEAISSLF
jgi:hypothetical protein